MLLVHPIDDATRALVFERLCRERGFKLTRGNFVRKWEGMHALEVCAWRDGVRVSASAPSLGPGAFFGYFASYRARADRAHPLASDILAMLAETGESAEIRFVDNRPMLAAVVIAIVALWAIVMCTIEIAYPVHRSDERAVSPAERPGERRAPR